MVTIHASETDLLRLGRVGENDRTQIIFDTVIRKWLDEYPNAIISLLNRHSRDSSAYPVANIQQIDATVVWTVKSSDLTQDGRGQCQLVATEDGVIVKSEFWDTNVLPSLSGDGTPPPPWVEWQIAFTLLKNEAEAAAAQAIEAANHYPMIRDRIWYVWSVETESYVSTGIVAEGIDGISPVITSEDIPGGHRLTIVDAAHPLGFTVDVMNGSDGKGIRSITKTSSSGLEDTYTIEYTSGSPTTFKVTNGRNGTDGVNAYVHFRWADHEPTQDSDMKTIPGPWMGVYSGNSASAPIHHTDYQWNDVQGPVGPQGLAFTFEDSGTGLVLKPLEQEA